MGRFPSRHFGNLLLTSLARKIPGLLALHHATNICLIRSCVNDFGLVFLGYIVINSMKCWLFIRSATPTVQEVDDERKLYHEMQWYKINSAPSLILYETWLHLQARRALTINQCRMPTCNLHHCKKRRSSPLFTAGKARWLAWWRNDCFFLFVVSNFIDCLLRIFPKTLQFFLIYTWKLQNFLKFLFRQLILVLL